MADSYVQELLASLLPQWHSLLQDWSSSGRLTAAAQEALLLNEEPQALKDLVAQWSSGDFSSLPPIVLLSSNDISGAMGAYAISTGTIYLNQDWKKTASTDQVNAVLTEELGHHLDGLLNAVDTPGDEGDVFASLLSKRTSNAGNQTDSGTIETGGKSLSSEFSNSQDWQRYIAYDLEGGFSNGLKGTLKCSIEAVSADSTGDLYYAGNATRAFSNQHGGYYRSGVGAFIAKLSDTGELIWIKTFDDPSAYICSGYYEDPFSVAANGTVSIALNNNELSSEIVLDSSGNEIYRYAIERSLLTGSQQITHSEVSIDGSSWIITGGDGSAEPDTLTKISNLGRVEWTINNSGFHTADITIDENGIAVLIGGNGIRVISPTGETIRTISTPGGGYSVDVNKDGSFVAGGYINNGPAWLSCYDAQGAPIWDIRLGSNYTELHDVRIEANGNIVASTTYGRVFEVSPTGSLLWDSGERGDFRAIRAVDTSSNGCIGFTFGSGYAASSVDATSIFSDLQDVSSPADAERVDSRCCSRHRQQI